MYYSERFKTQTEAIEFCRAHKIPISLPEKIDHQCWEVVFDSSPYKERTESEWRPNTGRESSGFDPDTYSYQNKD